MPSSAYITLVGHLAADPTTRHTPSGMQVTTFSIPVNSKSGDKESVTWWRITAFSKQAEFVQNNLVKGDLIQVMGSPKTNEYQAKDGTTKTSLEVAADRVLALSRTEKAQAAKAAPAGNDTFNGSLNDDEDSSDLPF